ncbi:hypothetical protein SRRS_07150 [Sporomusa rhizae]|uniref:major capsid protein n=1 Tax=Sporomusa rhizae TaxID=357999 RepID=UPI00352AFBC2
MDIFDLINPKEIATYYTETTSNKIPYLGSVLFPNKKRLGLNLEWFKGSKSLPVMLASAAFDTKATLRDRIGVSKLETEMPFFRESMRIGEKERQQLLMAVSASNNEVVKPILANIYDDITNLINGSDVVAERMRMQLLYSGTISVSANGVPYDYDYKFKASHKKALTGTAVWSDVENSDPIANIQEWQDLIEEDTGIRPTRAICTRKTWNYLMKNKKIKLDMNPSGGQNIIMTDKLLQQYLVDKIGLTVAVYNKKYLTEVGGNSEPFFPDDVFTLIPEGNLGNTFFGTTPEEADLMSGKSRAKVEIVNTGVAVTTYVEEHPVNALTIVSAVCLPSFESIDSVFIADVA